MKGGCHHYDGGNCVECDNYANSCCGDDKTCDECNNELCRDCYDKRKGICPVCSGEIVTNDTLLEFFLNKYHLTREQAVQTYKKALKREQKANSLLEKTS